MTDRAFTLHHIEPARATSMAPQIAGIWQTANGLDPEAGREFLLGTLPKHIAWPNFRLIVAAIDGHPVGFVYGYTSLPGQWWHDQIAPPLSTAHDGWLHQPDELAELAVLPPFQGRGLGAALVRAFLETTTRRTILAVESSAEVAHRLYARHGFVDLVTTHYEGFPNDPIIVMGREPTSHANS